ncbi:MAG TPA: dynamin family protein [Anaerolineaceae bacterium]|nr:dynamin family protein [Anaerolineaceae bacterium]
MKILTTSQEALIRDERNLLSDLRVLLVEFGATVDDQTTLAQSIQQLDEIFLLVVVGEFNAGKSAFINAFLGQRLLKEGVTPTTTQINIIRYGEMNDRQVVDEHQHILSLPAEVLREISIVDTPGTNAIIREHEAITALFVPRSDLVLFITSVDRPFTESERAFLEDIRDWGKKIVIIVNKIDLLNEDEELNEVIRFITENAQRLLGITPEVFPVSARLALRAKNGDPSVWSQSRFEPLEKYIQDTLDEKGRIQLKLRNPLGVGSFLTDRYLKITEERMALLKDDFQMLADVEAQLGVYREDMQRDFQFRLADIDNILLEMEKRGRDFFDETFRLGRVFDLFNKQRVQQEYEHTVIADVPQQVERKVGEIIDWLVDADFREWEAINEHLSKRRQTHQDRIVGDPGVGTFHFDRDRLMDAIGRDARRMVDSYDKTREASEIAENAQSAVAASAAIEVGAVGLGTLVTVLATTAAADVTGILMATFIAALGLFVIPARRQQAKSEMTTKVAELRTKLVDTLRAEFMKELDRSQQKINDAIAPYTRFVRAEQTKLTVAQEKLLEQKRALEQIRVRIETME